MSGKRERVRRSHPIGFQIQVRRGTVAAREWGYMGGWHEPYGENGYSRQKRTPPDDAQLAREGTYPLSASLSAWNGLADADTSPPARPAAPSWDQAYQAPTLP